MCGIAGFSSFTTDYAATTDKWTPILEKMNEVQKHRGPDENGIYMDEHCGLAHVRLSIIDLSTGQQPMTHSAEGRSCTIVYNGEIYNMRELRRELRGLGVQFQTESDTEVILAGYEVHGINFVKKLNGIFAFAIWDAWKQKLYLFRDRSGVKPLFYTIYNNTMVFASEIKGLFCYPGIQPEVDKEGLCEVFGLGPAKTYGKGVFRNVNEVLPAHIVEFGENGVHSYAYWKLESRPHEENFNRTVERTEELVTGAIREQMLSDVPICTFLSGGVDSSLVTAVCSKELQKQGKQLDTYSFDFVDNSIHFQSNAFQPTQDRPWVEQMVKFANTNHHFLECNNEDLYDYLFDAVDARDLPCMADVESSMLYFCKKVAGHNKVTLTGECADEIFGGYPWFHKKECFEAEMFPWSMDFKPRTMLLKDEVLRELPLEDYARVAYEKTIQETPKLSGEGKEESRRREIAYLNLKWFMQTLLDRMDRTSMHSGLEARVPLADHRIIEYVWNVPWEMKCHNGIVKGLLRAAGENYLPSEVLYRKKSPYPKTYDPAYEDRLRREMREVLQNANAPIHVLLDHKKVEEFMRNPTDYGRPFYGQLMAGPQLLAYLLQVNYWLEKYRVRILG
ncbi:MAG: asparagine synthase (glutamine-hydrolyzing) [Lachnospiraceae bacterium]|nr:asparagine synthase (glutamine-hydrolyzing) [Lachnospiraceae bacterium]